MPDGPAPPSSGSPTPPAATPSPHGAGSPASGGGRINRTPARDARRQLGRHVKLMATEAYCVKCKAKREMQNENKITMKNGKPATEGTCPVCGTKMFKI